MVPSCISCGADLPPGGFFCALCGTKVPGREPSAPCGRCGRMLGRGDQFCGMCGARAAQFVSGQPDVVARTGAAVAAWMRSRLAGGRQMDTRDLLAIEQARSAPERRLLLARECSVMVERILAIGPADRTSWPSAHDLALTHERTAVLLASATDPYVAFLPETRPDDLLTIEQIVETIHAAISYIELLQAQLPVRRPGIDQLRVLMRERTRLQVAFDEILLQLQEQA
jgi:hypothetical protein